MASVSRCLFSALHFVLTYSFAWATPGSSQVTLIPCPHDFETLWRGVRGEVQNGITALKERLEENRLGAFGAFVRSQWTLDVQEGGPSGSPCQLRLKTAATPLGTLLSIWTYGPIITLSVENRRILEISPPMRQKMPPPDPSEGTLSAQVAGAKPLILNSSYTLTLHPQLTLWFGPKGALLGTRTSFQTLCSILWTPQTLVRFGPIKGLLHMSSETKKVPSHVPLEDPTRLAREDPPYLELVHLSKEVFTNTEDGVRNLTHEYMTNPKNGLSSLVVGIASSQRALETGHGADGELGDPYQRHPVPGEGPLLVGAVHLETLLLEEGVNPFVAPQLFEDRFPLYRIPTHNVFGLQMVTQKEILSSFEPYVRCALHTVAPHRARPLAKALAQRLWETSSDILLITQTLGLPPGDIIDLLSDTPPQR